jgi:hypothetical protein
MLCGFARKRTNIKISVLKKLHRIIIHLNCQEKRPFIIGLLNEPTSEQPSPVKTYFLSILTEKPNAIQRHP